MVGIIMQIKDLHTFKALKKANNDVPISCKVNSFSLVYSNNVSYLYVYVTKAVMNYNS